MTMAVTKLSSVTRTAYSNEVGDYKISYGITQNNEEMAERITADVRKGELRYGNVYANSDGSVNVNFNPKVSDEDKKLIFSTCVDDVKTIFDELNKA